MIGGVVTEESAPGLPARPSTPMPYWVSLLPLLLVPAVVGLDQLTKWIIRNSIDRGEVWPGDWLVHIVHVTNNGAAFGMLSSEWPESSFTS